MSFDAGSLFVSVIVSGVGFIYFRYGRLKERPLYVVGGIVLMVYPYFVGGALPMILVGVGLVGLMWAAARAGW